jgi:hypothetical protein
MDGAQRAYHRSDCHRSAQSFSADIPNHNQDTVPALCNDAKEVPSHLRGGNVCTFHLEPGYVFSRGDEALLNFSRGFEFESQFISPTPCLPRTLPQGDKQSERSNKVRHMNQFSSPNSRIPIRRA